jgi:magnesium transporter
MLPVDTIGRMVRTRAWRRDGDGESDFDVARVSDLIAEDGTVVWIDYTDPTAEDLADVEEELGVHALAAEDALEAGQRPKLDRYRDGLFLVAYDAVTSGRTLATHEVKAFVTRDALVTMHGADFDMAEVERRWDDNADLAEHGVPYLTWGLLDVLVDHAADTVEHLEDRIEALDDDLFAEHTREHHVQKRSFAIRKQLGVVRRLVVPMEDVLASMTRGDAEQVTDGIRPYFRDVADHLSSIAASVDALRDAVSNVLDTNLNLASNRQNLVMKKVTSWAAIIAIPTAITGFFGMNTKLPGGSSWSGLALSVGLIVAASLVLYRVFKSRDWL